MKKNINIKSSTGIRLAFSGLVILALTPLVQSKVVEYLTKDCPFFGSYRQCGLEVGLKYALYVQALVGVWAVVGGTLLIVGLFKYYTSRKRVR